MSPKNDLKSLLLGLCTMHVFVLPVSRPALARETINWLLPDVAPAFIRDGDQAEEGFGDRQLAYLINHLADVDHKHFFASTNRIWYQIGHADGNCTLTAKKTPSREKIAIFPSSAIGQCQIR
jgi:uncharacterized protein (TIGR02285 family)